MLPSDETILSSPACCRPGDNWRRCSYHSGSGPSPPAIRSFSTNIFFYKKYFSYVRYIKTLHLDCFSPHELGEVAGVHGEASVGEVVILHLIIPSLHCLLCSPLTAPAPETVLTVSTRGSLHSCNLAVAFAMF